MNQYTGVHLSPKDVWQCTVGRQTSNVQRYHHSACSASYSVLSRGPSCVPRPGGPCHAWCAGHLACSPECGPWRESPSDSLSSGLTRHSRSDHRLRWQNGGTSLFDRECGLFPANQQLTFNCPTFQIKFGIDQLATRLRAVRFRAFSARQSLQLSGHTTWSSRLARGKEAREERL